MSITTGNGDDVIVSYKNPISAALLLKNSLKAKMNPITLLGLELCVRMLETAMTRAALTLLKCCATIYLKCISFEFAEMFEPLHSFFSCGVFKLCCVAIKIGHSQINV